MTQEINTDPRRACHASDNIIGTWFNTNRCAPAIARVEILAAGESLLVRPYGAEPTILWGEVAATPHASTLDADDITGFEARIQEDGHERYLVANLKLGVLVIQCYNQFRDLRQGNYFTREFFHQRIDCPSAAMAETHHATLPYVQAGDLPKPDDSQPADEIDLSPYLGTWQNTFRETCGVSHLKLFRDNGMYLVDGCGLAAPDEWGAVPAVAYADSVSSNRAAGFFADYDFGFMDMHLAANFNKGLLVVAAYNRFKDNSRRANYFTREFFYHEHPTT